MSKRRKNAGEGYGFMFSGAFSEKKDAVKKEKERKGSFIKGMPTRHGYRYVVMTPRTNPIKRRTNALGGLAPVSSDRMRVTFDKSVQKYMATKYDPRFGNQFATGFTRKEAAKNLRDVFRGLRHPENRNNPSELLVMGANPHENVQEIVLQPGARLVIRNNPADARPNSLASFFGFSPSKPTKKELSQSRREFRARRSQRVKEDHSELQRLARAGRASQRKTKTSKVFHELYGEQLYDAHGMPINPVPVCGAMIGGERCTRKPRHRGPHLPQGATMRTRTRLPHHWQPRGNPSAEALRESFTGTPVGRVKIYDEPHMPAGDYAMLGKVLTLYVKPRTGGQVQTITLHGVIAVADQTARQIYFVGGDQDVSAGLSVFGAIEIRPGIYELGQATRIDYRQRKEHVEHPDQDAWRHSFGEETGVRPVMLFDARNKRLLLEGGEYVIRQEGIVN